MSEPILIRNKSYNSFPIIHHCPEDYPQAIWNDLVRIRGSYAGTLNKPDNLTIITFNNTPERMLLEKRLVASNTPHTVLGKGIQPWKNPAKITLLKDYLEEVTTEYVLVLDDIDVIISSEISGIIDRFLEFECKVLYNASSVIYPREFKYSTMERELRKELFCHLNSGCFIGRTDYCLDLYKEVADYEDEITREHHYSDQIRLKAMYIKRHPEIKLDSRCSIFQVWNVKGMACKDMLEICCKYM